ncbi:hypothetical protein CEXT_346821 [Caerostris extrusa]|uniref:Uncharacterized protein n=1 Tax=Caerostris extrusa TaxID=172846 RepID=A0AAV4T1V6_CAEEX|nr:hypothetical protein CEXT_346821 [Caerostris extrusa]
MAADLNCQTFDLEWQSSKGVVFLRIMTLFQRKKIKMLFSAMGVEGLTKGWKTIRPGRRKRFIIGNKEASEWSWEDFGNHEEGRATDFGNRTATVC